MTKQLSNPFSSGSGGPIFETRVQAALASLMLCKGVCPCLPSWQIYKIKLQGKYAGFETDDVIVFVKDDWCSREAKLIAQIKHVLAITKKNAKFAQVIQSAWEDFNNPSVFEEGYDALALITGPLSATDTQCVRDLLEIARASQDSADFFDKIKLAKFSSDGKREKLKVFQHHLTNANGGTELGADVTWRFLRSFHLIGYDLDIKAGVIVSLLHSLIGGASPDDAEKVWLKILNEIQSWNPRAGVLTLQSLPKELLDHFRVVAPPQLPIVPATPVRETIAAAFIGAWDENSTGDQASIEAFTGMSFVEWQDRIREAWLTNPGLFDQRDGKWKVIDRLTFWNQEAPRASDSLLEQFKELAVLVLREDDPSLDLDTEDRFAAGVHGKERVHSGLIRKGIAETLALMGAEGEALSTCSGGKARFVAGSAVREILAGDNWRIWASANDVTSLLAEASPDSFLEAVQDAVTSGTAVFANIFSQESSGIMGRTYVTGILWGLESLAWKAEYLGPVCRILADLAAIDPGGNWSNRPANSLTTILLPWIPRTSAPTEKRHAAVTIVAKRHEDVGWRLVCSLLPQPHGSSSGTHKPVWQKFVTKHYENGVPTSQYWEDILFYSDLALKMAGEDVDRLVVLVGAYFRLPNEAREKLRERLSSEEVAALTEERRSRLWEALNQLTSNHRKFADNERWKVPEGALEELDVIADLLRPTSPEVRHKRLFAGRDFDLYEETGNYEEQEATLAARREEAVGQIFAAGGKELLTAFAKEVSEPWRVGFALGSLEQSEHDSWILPSLLADPDKSMVQFASGYVWGRHRSAGWDWVDSLPLSGWLDSQFGQFFAFLPFCKETWDRVSSMMAKNESAYWQRTSANAYEASSEIDEALEKLIAHDRPDSAIRCMYSLLHKTKKLPVEPAVKALQALVANHNLDPYAIGEIFSFLQKNAPKEESRLRVLEWKFMPFLGRFNNGQPVLLSRWLSEDPEFFCEVIQTLYRSRTEEAEPVELSEEAQAKALTAYHLLEEWKLPPGSQRDGTFSPDELTSWVDAVKAKCIVSGHWEVAASKIGEVLRYAPVDEEGLWVDPVCAVLEQDGHDRMRSGLIMEIFNGRGIFTPDGGKWETAAAENWEKIADRAETKGYSLLPQELRRLASNYRHDAERDAKRSSPDFD